MLSSRDQALATLGLGASPDADAETVQRTFERLARRYPQPSFPERFRQLLEARDTLLSGDRAWRELIESRTLDLSWILPYAALPRPSVMPDHRASLQNLLRAGLLAEPIAWQGPLEDEEGICRSELTRRGGGAL